MIIKFNKKIYKLKAIKSAIKKYQNLANFCLEEKEGYIWVRLTKIDQEVKDIIKDEFCNFALYLTKID